MDQAQSQAGGTGGGKGRKQTLRSQELPVSRGARAGGWGAVTARGPVPTAHHFWPRCFLLGRVVVLTERLLHSRHRSLVSPISVTLMMTIFGRENEGSEKLSDLPSVPQLVK